MAGMMCCSGFPQQVWYKDKIEGCCEGMSKETVQNNTGIRAHGEGNEV